MIRRVLRVEDEGFLRGETPFLRDLDSADCLHVAFVRSDVAHGVLRRVDVAAAAAAPGVVAVLTAADLALPPFRPFELVPAAFARPPLATDRTRFVGEPVALVVADGAAHAVDAAELVGVEIDPLPAVVGPDAALRPDATVLFPEAGSNVVIHYDRGRVADLFDDAAHVVTGRFPNQRLASAPLEPSAIVVRPEAGRLDVWATCQGVHGARHELAAALGVGPDGIRVRAAAVGGGFGGRHSVPVEFVVVAAAARHLRRALRWDETRTENLLTMVHGRAQCHEVAMGFDEDGRITALRVRNLADCGAYPHFGPVMPFISRQLACGPYRVPRVDYEWLAYATTTNPIGPYRGAGQPEVTNGLERVMDLAAAEIGIDPLELRRRNLVTADELPHTTVTKLTYDSGDYPAALQRAAELVDWPAARREQAERRARADRALLGVGIACYVSATDGRTEFGAVDVDAGDGTVTVRCGTLSHGQSHATTIGAAVASELGVGLEAIRFVDRDTDLVPRGQGTGGSRSAQMAGSAAVVAARRVLDRARALAADRLEATPDDIVVMPPAGDRPGGLGVVGVPTSVLGWAELARAAGPEGLGAEVDFELGGAAFSSGAHASLVEVDVETGAVRVLRHVAVDDCGTVLNPMVVAGQQHGGSAAGSGQALFEEISYDHAGTPRATTFADYLLPSAAELPSFDTETMGIPTPVAPNGAQGIGENGAVAAPTSVQNAVVDALAHLGVRHVDLPLTPEAVWTALRTAGRPG
jgi:carbon-monoxide dehydrogenase large subunit